MHFFAIHNTISLIYTETQQVFSDDPADRLEALINPFAGGPVQISLGLRIVETPSTPQRGPCPGRGWGMLGWFCFLESALNPSDSINVNPDTLNPSGWNWTTACDNVLLLMTDEFGLSTICQDRYPKLVSSKLRHDTSLWRLSPKQWSMPSCSWFKPATSIFFLCWTYPHFWLLMIAYFLCRHISCSYYVLMFLQQLRPPQVMVT